MFRKTRTPNGALPQSRNLKRFWREDAGQDLIEYALVAALLGLMSAAALSPVAQALNNGVNTVEKKFKKHTHQDSGKHKGWYK